MNSAVLRGPSSGFVRGAGLRPAFVALWAGVDDFDAAIRRRALAFSLPLARTIAPFAALAVLASGAAPAAEIDSFTSRGEVLRDATGQLESWLNDRLREGVERANDSGEACDEDALYDAIRGSIASPFIGHLVAEELNRDPDLDSRRVRFPDSIYRDFGLFDAVSMHVKDLSAVVRIGDHLVGVDKFGHFLVQGWHYFETAYLDGEGIDAAMDWGEHTERTYFGRYTTGIYSYADLAANFDGMRFWLRILGSKRDPLGGGWWANRPYVGCGRGLPWRERHWRVKRRVDLSRYVSAAWDEGDNCSAYRNERIASLVAQRIREAGAKEGADYSCPIEPGACADARERYAERAERLLHPACLKAVRPARPWWRFW